MTWLFPIAIAAWSVACLCAGMLLMATWHNQEVKEVSDA